MKTIGFLDSASFLRFYEWIMSLDLGEVVKSTYAPNRKEKFFRLGSNLGNPKAGGRITVHEEPPDWIAELGDKLLPGWHSILVCGGDTTIDWHRDHPHFEAMAVMINLGEAEYSQRNGNPIPDKIHLYNGEMVEIDTKLLHKARPLSEVRMNLTFRKIKEEYLPIEYTPLFTEIK